MTIEGSWEKSKTWTAWAGPEHQFEAVLETMELHVEALKDGLLKYKTRFSRTDLSQALKQEALLEEKLVSSELTSRQIELLDRQLEDARRSVADAKREIEKQEGEVSRALLLRMQLRGRDDSKEKYVGTASELTRVLQRAAFKGFDIDAPAGFGTGSSIRLSASTLTGVELTVESKDAKWARAAYQQLTDEIAKNVPWWRFLRNAPIIGFIVVPIFSFAALMLARALYPGETSSSSAWIVTLAFGVIPGMAATYNIVKWIPFVEIISTGGTPRGLKALGVIAGLAASAVIGFAINQIS